MRPTSWAGLICRQHYHRQWLPNTQWWNSRRWAWGNHWQLFWISHHIMLHNDLLHRRSPAYCI